MDSENFSNEQVQLFDVDTFLRIYPISRSKFYREIKKERLKATKLGNRTYIKRKHAEEWMELLDKDSNNV